MSHAALSSASDEDSRSESDDASWSETSSSAQPISGQQGATTANNAPVAGTLATMLQADMMEASRHGGAVAAQPTVSLADMLAIDALLQPQHMFGEPSSSSRHDSMLQPHREVERGAACDNMHCHGNANAATVGCSNTVTVVIADGAVHDCRSDSRSAGSPCRPVLITPPRRPAPAATESCCHACAATAAKVAPPPLDACRSYSFDVGADFRDDSYPGDAPGDAFR